MNILCILFVYYKYFVYYTYNKSCRTFIENLYIYTFRNERKISFQGILYLR